MIRLFIGLIVIQFGIFIWYFSTIDIYKPKAVAPLVRESCKRVNGVEFIRKYAPHRYELHKDMIVNYDWNTSCVNHFMYPVAPQQNI